MAGQGYNPNIYWDEFRLIIGLETFNPFPLHSMCTQHSTLNISYNSPTYNFQPVLIVKEGNSILMSSADEGDLDRTLFSLPLNPFILFSSSSPLRTHTTTTTTLTFSFNLQDSSPQSQCPKNTGSLPPSPHDVNTWTVAGAKNLFEGTIGIRIAVSTSKSLNLFRRRKLTAQSCSA